MKKYSVYGKDSSVSFNASEKRARKRKIKIMCATGIITALAAVYCITGDIQAVKSADIKKSAVSTGIQAGRAESPESSSEDRTQNNRGGEDIKEGNGTHEKNQVTEKECGAEKSVETKNACTENNRKASGTGDSGKSEIFIKADYRDAKIVKTESGENSVKAKIETENGNTVNVEMAKDTYETMEHKSSNSGEKGCINVKYATVDKAPEPACEPVKRKILK